ncbi:MAG: T9SS type A sorting domain-containing protein [Flavobacteriales bacterium]|nr:T9SS type A sorting domain-containing protein [Flavobacteriales bacterium]
MRSVGLLVTILWSLGFHAQTVVQSVTDGDWTDPSTWDCACVPQDGDTVLVDHSITLAVDLTFLDGWIVVGSAGLLNGMPDKSFTSSARFTNHGSVLTYRFTLLDAQTWTDSLVNTGAIYATRMAVRRRGVNTGTITTIDSLVFDRTSFWNEGSISSRVTWIRDSLVWNDGLFTSYDLTVDSSGLFHNAGSCDVTHDLVIRNTGNYTAADGSTLNRVVHDVDLRWGLNLWAAEMTIGNRLLLSDADGPIPHVTFFTTGGSIHTKDLVNKGWLAGPGIICISDSSINEGSLHPGLVICDATTTTLTWPFLDVDLGTVDPSVQFCPAGSCSVGLPDHATGSGPTLFPLPFHEELMLRFAQEDPLSVTIRSMDGAELPTVAIVRGDLMTFDLSAAPAGIYFVEVRSAQQRRVLRAVKQ